MAAAVVFIALIAGIFGIMYVFFTNRNKERMALIEKGADASLFNTGKEVSSFFCWSRFSLKFGLLMIGIGIGIIVGAIFESFGIFNDEGVCYASMVFIFGGLGLVSFYLIDRKSK